MKKIVSYIFLTFTSVCLFALEVPALKKAVNDVANVLDLGQQEELERYLRGVMKTSKLQIALLTIPSLGDEQIESYSLRVVEKWKLGNRERDSGALLLIAKEERQIRIEVGYGLEKDLTDAVSSKIIRDVIVPHFKEDDYYSGIKKGLEAIVAYSLKDETLMKGVEKNKTRIWQRFKPHYWYMILPILMFLLSIASGRFAVKNQRGGKILWILSLIISFFEHRGRYGGRHGRGGWTDDDSSDSFSGDGGRFGGGGATGKW